MRQDLRIVVFGRADLQPGTSDYRDALELGGLVAREGWIAATGGYGGAMHYFEMGSSLWALRKPWLLLGRPLVLLGSAWGAILDGLRRAGALEENLLEWALRAEETRSAVGVPRDALGEGSLDGKAQR